jgi:hypothetical protein
LQYCSSAHVTYSVFVVFYSESALLSTINRTELYRSGFSIDHGFECGGSCIAGASAAAWTCGDSVAEAELEVTAKALAKAAAQALSFAYAQCKIENGWACAVAGTEIEETARAVAQAYATLWAGADNGAICGADSSCSVSVDAIASAVGDVLVTACTDAYASVCSGMRAPLRSPKVLLFTVLIVHCTESGTRFSVRVGSGSYHALMHMLLVDVQ